MASASNRSIVNAPDSPPQSPTQPSYRHRSRFSVYPGTTPVVQQRTSFTIPPNNLRRPQQQAHPPRYSSRPSSSANPLHPSSASSGAIFRFDEDMHEAYHPPTLQSTPSSYPASSFLNNQSHIPTTARRAKSGSYKPPSSHSSYSSLGSYSGPSTPASSGSNRNLFRPSNLQRLSPANPIDPRLTRSSAIPVGNNRRNTLSASLPASYTDHRHNWGHSERPSKHPQSSSARARDAPSALSASPSAPIARSVEPRHTSEWNRGTWAVGKSDPIVVPPRRASTDRERPVDAHAERRRRMQRKERLKRPVLPPIRPNEPTSSSSSSDTDLER